MDSEGGRRAGGGGVNGGDGAEKKIRGILGAGEGGETERSAERKKEVACSQQRGRGKSCEIARGTEESASLGLC